MSLEPPPALAELRERLEREGFAPPSEPPDYDGVFELSDGTRTLRIVGDKGQWRVDFLIDGKWFADTELVLAGIEQRDARSTPFTPEAEAAAAGSILPRLPKGPGEAAELRRRTEAAAQRRAQSQSEADWADT